MVQMPPGSGKSPEDEELNYEATRILMPHTPAAEPAPGAAPGAGAGAGDGGATRILPAHPVGARPSGQAAVIGVAGQNRQQQQAEEGRTVMMPVGIVNPSPQETFDPAVGWIVIVEGPGRGHHCPVYYGQNSIGRGADQRIRLGFGDTRIARDSHAFLIYDDVARKFYLRDNGKTNLVRLNGAPVMAPMPLNDRDRIQIGETVMMFVPLCGENFDWLAGNDSPSTAPGA